LPYTMDMPKPTLRSDGRWMLQLPRQNDGKRRPCVYGRTAHECLQKYNERLGGGRCEVVRGSVAEFVATTFAIWLDKRRLKSTTLARYDHAWKTVLFPAIGDHKFAELTTTMIQSVFSNSAYQPSTLANAKNVLGQIMKLAVAEGVCQHHVITMVQIAKIPPVPRKERFNVGEQSLKVYQAAKEMGHWTEGFIWICMTFGLRKAEACGLKVTDIDKDAGTLTIQRQRNHVEGETEGTKTKAKRVIDLPENLMEKLLSYVKPGSIYIIVNEKGKPPITNHFERHLEPVLAKAGVHITPHDLRAAAIANLVDAGANIADVRSVAGHGTDEMTLSYMDKSRRRTATALGLLESSDNQG
jgi:integrase